MTPRLAGKCVRLVTALAFAVAVGGCAQVGPEVTSGPGWRLVGIVDPVRTGIGRAPDVVIGPAGSAPVAVQSESDLLEVVGSRAALQVIPDFARELVVVFPVLYGPVLYGPGCGEPVLRSVTISEKKHRVDARIEFRGEVHGACTAPGALKSYVVAIERAALPATPFTVGFDSAESNRVTVG
jgi:hypothetical protein